MKLAKTIIISALAIFGALAVIGLVIEVVYNPEPPIENTGTTTIEETDFDRNLDGKELTSSPVFMEKFRSTFMEGCIAEDSTTESCACIYNNLIADQETFPTILEQLNTLTDEELIDIISPYTEGCE